MAGWLNDDELYWKFGTDRATPANGGEYNVLGGEHWVEFDLDLTTLSNITDIATEKGIINDVVSLPKEVRVVKVEVLVLTASAGANANLNLGLVRFDRSTAIDADGLLAAADAWHTAAAGTKTVYEEGTTEAGALLGDDVGANPGLFTAHYDTGAFTAGLVKIRVYWIKV